MSEQYTYRHRIVARGGLDGMYNGSLLLFLLKMRAKTLTPRTYLVRCILTHFFISCFFNSILNLRKKLDAGENNNVSSSGGVFIGN